jgi:hypothetical protein
MSAEQLCFFKFSRPLLDLLGKEFFQSVPAQPGVYLFVGERRRILYVGQSKNLRQRLGYYKNAQPEREPRRIIRLVHQTRAIELQTCESPAAAEARELELIQEHQPRFNVRHALSRTYSFFGVRTEGGRLSIRLALEPAKRTDEEMVIGAFKNRGLCRRGLFAIARTLWGSQRAIDSIYALPLWLLDRTRLNEIELSDDGGAGEEMLSLLRGDSADLLRRTERNAASTADPFVKALFDSDLLLLTEFFALAVRMRELRERSGIQGLLPQREVDRVLLARTKEGPRDDRGPSEETASA